MIVSTATVWIVAGFRTSGLLSLYAEQQQPVC
jgi:hypothetical protein